MTALTDVEDPSHADDVGVDAHLTGLVLLRRHFDIVGKSNMAAVQIIVLVMVNPWHEGALDQVVARWCLGAERRGFIVSLAVGIDGRGTQRLRRNHDVHRHCRAGDESNRKG
jgi:hypothetical protein